MKKIAVGMLAAFAMTGTAFAADMAPRYTKAPPPPPPVVYNWTGCYIGGNVGGGWERTRQTQIAKVGLAARFEQFYPVVIGTTLGMMLANIPVVAIGDRIADKLPVKAIRLVAAAVFAALGVLTMTGIGE